MNWTGWRLLEAARHPRHYPAVQAFHKGWLLVVAWEKTSIFTVKGTITMKSSTTDKIEGGLREAKGKVKEEVGQATGNADLEGRGVAEKMAGKAQRKVGDVKKVFNQ
jgi:uncharacterized protein YjbJ (UPF0337 family)